MVLIGSARIDENGKISGGKAGDQTGKETSIQDWYLHNKGWVVIRAKDAVKREKIAQDMQYICDNPCVGYDQGSNQTLYNEAKKVGFDVSKVKNPCETDCARAVRVCVLYAGINCADFYTGIEADVLKATGQFEILTADKYCKQSDYLLRGDILVTKTKGHTVVVLTNGAKATASKPSASPVLKPADAQYSNVTFAGAYKPTEDLYMRTNAGKQYKIITTVKTSETVRNYGFYNIDKTGRKWLYVALKRKDETITGYCSASYLRMV